MEYTFYIQNFWATCAYPEKQLPWNFSLYWIYFLHSGFLRNLCLPWKTEGAQEFFTVLNMYFLSFRIFEQLALALKNRVALEFFTVLKYFFIIQDIWATSACPENSVCPEIFQTRGCGRPPPPRTPMHIPLQSVFAWQSSSPLTLDRITTNAKRRSIWNIFQTECSFISTSLRYKTRFSTADPWVAEQVVLQLLCQSSSYFVARAYWILAIARCVDVFKWKMRLAWNHCVNAKSLSKQKITYIYARVSKPLKILYAIVRSWNPKMRVVFHVLLAF